MIYGDSDLAGFAVGVLKIWGVTMRWYLKRIAAGTQYLGPELRDGSVNSAGGVTRSLCRVWGTQHAGNFLTRPSVTGDVVPRTCFPRGVVVNLYIPVDR